jgi:hypothetical protein
MTRSLRFFIFASIVMLLAAACGNQATTEAVATQPPPSTGVAATDTAAPATAPAPTTTEAVATEAPAPTESPTASAEAQVGESQNDVVARTSESDSLAPAQVGFQLNLGGQVKTGAASKARLDFKDGSLLRMGENSFFTLLESSQTDQGLYTKLKVEIGKFWISLTGGTLEMETPVGSASVRGSWAVFEYDPGDPNDPNDDVFTFKCLEGECVVVIDGETIRLSNFESFTVRKGGQQTRDRGCLSDEDVTDFSSNNPEGGALGPTLTAVAGNKCTEEPSPTPSETPTRRPTRPPPLATSTETSTPQPQCREGEYYDPFLNRCRRPEDNTPYAGLALNDSPLYNALARTQNATPVGLMSIALMVLGVVVVGWSYRRRDRG